jgi:thiamine pyrophosphate-dependent acetolactate synthase large subunit-like protein
LRVIEAIARDLYDCGLRHCFGLIGEDVGELLDELRRLGVAYYSARHESAAVAMADGYARASGTVGVAVVSKGPGLLNAMNALETASKGGSSVLVIVGDSPPDQSAVVRGRKGKYIDQTAILTAAGIQNVRLICAESALADVRRAYDCSAVGQTVVVNLPDPVAMAEAGTAPASSPLPITAKPMGPDPAVISDVCDLLEATFIATKPVILAGRGAVRADARAHLERLGELCGALMGSTVLANGMFRGNPYNIGIMGSFSTPVALDLLNRADVVLSFGASLNGRTTYGGELCAKARFVQFDSDPDAFGRYSFVSPELQVTGDIGLAAAALVEELERRGHGHEGFRTSKTADQIAAFDPRSVFRDQSDDTGLDPRAVLLEIDKLLPDDRVIVTDGGHHFNFECTCLRAYEPSSWISPLDFSSIGSGTGVANGAAVARPDRLTVLCVGDGGLMMTIGEIATAARYGLPVLVLVNNNAGFGSDMHILELDGYAPDVARLDEQSFEAIATAMGVRALTIRSLSDVEKLPPLLEDRSGPVVVEYKVTNAVVADSLSSFVSMRSR